MSPLTFLYPIERQYQHRRFSESYVVTDSFRYFLGRLRRHADGVSSDEGVSDNFDETQNYQATLLNVKSFLDRKIEDYKIWYEKDTFRFYLEEARRFHGLNLRDQEFESLVTSAQGLFQERFQHYMSQLPRLTGEGEAEDNPYLAVEPREIQFEPWLAPQEQQSQPAPESPEEQAELTPEEEETLRQQLADTMRDHIQRLQDQHERTIVETATVKD